MTSAIELPRSTPERQGIASAAIAAFLNGLEERGLELHGLMFMRHGHVVSEGWWEPYRPEYPHILNSITKSFTSTAVGFAVEEGLLSVEDEVLSYFPGELGEAEMDNMRGLKIKHLLSMTTGHTEDTSRFHVRFSFLNDFPDLHVSDRTDNDWVKGFFGLPIEKTPGTHFLYNSGASHILSVLVQRTSGLTLEQYLQPRLFEPLGILHPLWDKTSAGDNTGGWGLRLTTEDVARFGLFLLNKGVWNGQRLLSERWIEEATAKHAETPYNAEAIDWSQGYGYQFWRCRHGAYRADGAFGQYCVVLPEQNAVVAIHGCVQDMQAVLDLIWDKLLPAMGPEKPEDPRAHAQLEERLKKLSIATGGGFAQSASAGRRRYQMAENEEGIREIELRFAGEKLEFRWLDGAGEHTLNCGMESWVQEDSLQGERAFAQGSWTDEHTLILNICRVHTPFHDQAKLSFEGDNLRLHHRHIDFVSKERLLSGVRID
ncbi:serine hydrolase domain-containing protein [Cohnella boryungensis]|uniref:Serine hydrolase domain-containing protein n=1 Tax=Cohnella boryungensis TaxID=768479 RepID=A0ABV8S900_9BACL